MRSTGETPCFACPVVSVVGLGTESLSEVPNRRIRFLCCDCDAALLEAAVRLLLIRVLLAVYVRMSRTMYVLLYE